VIGLFLLLALAMWALPQPIERTVTDTTTGKTRTVTAWDTSRWQALTAVWWQVLLLALGLTTLLGVVWAGRGRVLRIAAAARFFVASVLIHSLLVLWLCAVPLARAVVERAEDIRISQAAQLFEEAPKQAQTAGGPAAFEKLADLRVEDRRMPDLIRQTPAPVDVASMTGPLTATIPAHAVRSLPPERLLFVPPRQAEVVRLPQEIERRGPAHALKPVEARLDLPELPPPEAIPREKPLDARPVAEARREPVVPAPTEPEALRLPELQRPRLADLRPEATDSPRTPEAAEATDPLSGRRQVPPAVPAAPRERETPLKAEASPRDRPPEDVRVTVPRLAPPPISVRPPDQPDESRPPPKRVANVAKPVPQRVDVRSGPSLPEERLSRKSPDPIRPAKVEDKAEPPPALLLRQKEVRQQSVEEFGGTKESEAAVERGLDWLAAHQNPQGCWGLNTFHNNCKHPACPDAGTVSSDPAGTGVVLLPFLGAGHTHQAGKHQQTVARALQWLVAHQGPEGTWAAPSDARPMYGHGMASIALCEAYGMTQDPKLRAPAQKALDYIVKAQHAPSGGWRYRPNQPADTSVVGWQLMALKSGEMAGLSVPPKAFEGVKRWLASVEANRPTGGLFGYQSAIPTPAMTAQGLLCLQYLGARRDEPRMQAGTDYLLKHLPRPGADTSYYWYHATQVMYHMQGKHWKAWNPRMRERLVSTQARQGSLAGSWKPADAREQPGGRLYATALRLLMLEVYYRHLPLYQQLEKGRTPGP
jgi:hypothetical protein